MPVSINSFKPFTTPTSTITFNGIDITVKKYATFAEKQFITNSISEIYFTYDDETNESGENLKQPLFTCLVAKFYADIELTKSISEDYDTLITSGLFNAILDNIPSSEIDMLNQMIDESIDAIKYEKLMNKLTSVEFKLDDIKNDSLEITVKNFLDNLTDKKLLSFMDKGIKKFNKIDPDKFSTLQSMLKEVSGKEMVSPENAVKALDQMREFVAKKKK